MSLMKVLKKNWFLVCLVVGLCIFGIVMIYSASFYSAERNFGNRFYFVSKQVVGLLIGICAMMFMAKFNYHKYTKYRYWILAISIVLLVLVFVPFIGISSNGARRWIGVGGFTIQSSEVAKFGFVIFASAYMSLNFEKLTKFKGILPILIAGGLICFLILLEPNLSVTLCVGMVMVIMLVIGGIRLKHFFIIALPALALVPILIIIEPYRLDRLLAFLDPWASPREEGFQLIQSLYALGSGGFFGVGLFNSRQKYLFLPFSESDFIFSIIGEELGLVGAIIVLMVYLLIIIQGVRIALSAKDRLGTYLGFGITSVICVQTLINVAVVTGSIPPTGIPLPFISAGGTSLIVFLASIGILLNISNSSEAFKLSFIKSKYKSYKISKYKF